MSYINHLNRFFEISRRDQRLTSHHFSLYIALFHAWNRNHFKNLFSICNQELMACSHIGSRSTFQKAITDLHHFGYIRMHKPGNRFGRSLVAVTSLNNTINADQPSLFDAGNELELNSKNPVHSPKNNSLPCPKMGTVSGSKVGSKLSKNEQPPVQKWAPDLPKNEQPTCPKMGTIKDKDYKEGIKREGNNTLPNAPVKKMILENAKDSFAGGQKCVPMSMAALVPYKQTGTRIPCKKYSRPTLKQVHHFFSKLKEESNLAFEVHKESEKFFAHYSANGWKLGGTTPIINWQAAGQKWVLNCWNSNHPPKETRQTNITLTPGANSRCQDYSTPL